MTLAEAIQNSGDSELTSYSYENGVLKLRLVLGETDQPIELLIKTQLLHINVDSVPNTSKYTCYIELQELSEVLDQKHPIYIAPQTFEALMEHKRYHYNLAYGLHSDNKLLFSLVGSSRFLVCVVKDLTDIVIIAQ